MEVSFLCDFLTSYGLSTPAVVILFMVVDAELFFLVIELVAGLAVRRVDRV